MGALSSSFGELANAKGPVGPMEATRTGLPRVLVPLGRYESSRGRCGAHSAVRSSLGRAYDLRLTRMFRMIVR